MDSLLHWDFTPGLAVEAQVRRRYRSSVHFSSSPSSKEFFLVAYFSSASFELSVESVGLALQSCIGGDRIGFKVFQLSDRRFRFSVDSNKVGHFIYSLRDRVWPDFICHFNLFRGFKESSLSFDKQVVSSDCEILDVSHRSPTFFRPNLDFLKQNAGSSASELAKFGFKPPVESSGNLQFGSVNFPMESSSTLQFGSLNFEGNPSPDQLQNISPSVMVGNISVPLVTTAVKGARFVGSNFEKRQFDSISDSLLLTIFDLLKSNYSASEVAQTVNVPKTPPLEYIYRRLNKCAKCGLVGHQATACTYVVSLGPIQQEKKIPKRVRKHWVKVVCGKCKGLGHSAKNCRSRKVWIPKSRDPQNSSPRSNLTDCTMQAWPDSVTDFSSSSSESDLNASAALLVLDVSESNASPTSELNVLHTRDNLQLALLDYDQEAQPELTIVPYVNSDPLYVSLARTLLLQFSSPDPITDMFARCTQMEFQLFGRDFIDFCNKICPLGEGRNVRRKLSVDMTPATYSTSLVPYVPQFGAIRTYVRRKLMINAGNIIPRLGNGTISGARCNITESTGAAGIIRPCTLQFSTLSAPNTQTAANSPFLEITEISNDDDEVQMPALAPPAPPVQPLVPSNSQQGKGKRKKKEVPNTVKTVRRSDRLAELAAGFKNSQCAMEAGSSSVATNLAPQFEASVMDDDEAPPPHLPVETLQAIGINHCNMPSSMVSDAALNYISSDDNE